MAIDVESFKQRMETASHYVHFVIKSLENSGKIVSPYNQNAALIVASMILKKLSYSGEKTAAEFLAEAHSSFRHVYTNEQLVWIIATSQSLLTVINKDMEDAIESLA